MEDIKTRKEFTPTYKTTGNKTPFFRLNYSNGVITVLLHTHIHTYTQTNKHTVTSSIFKSQSQTGKLS